MGSQGIRVALQLALGIVIVGLAYWLYVSITKPYEAVERRKELTEMTRARMDDIRVAMIQYERKYDRFPMTLDSLVMFVRTDSLLSLRPDSIFGAGFMLDSLSYSPRTRKLFSLSVNDTSRVKIYLLQDPDSDDRIGSTSPDLTLLNAASWE